MSIIEVLFAILITTVGLFGAIAIFPVASSQARKARTNDAVAAAARSAIHTFDTMGMRRLDRWYYWNTAASPNQFSKVTFAQSQSYCIDSRLLVANAGTASAAFFPYNSTLNGTGAVNSNTAGPRMHRIGFFGSRAFLNSTQATLLKGNQLLADSIFQLEDDLAYSRPGLDEVVYLDGTKVKSDRSLPAVQLFDVSTTNSPIKRQTQGHLSWIATLVPKVDLFAGAGSDEFVLSVVVFYDRPTDLALDGVTERVVGFTTQDDGSTGGEVALYAGPYTETTANEEDAAARLKLRPNNWVLLACTVTQGTHHVNRFQWYRVTDCDDRVEFAKAGGVLPNRYQLYATLMGPDWSWGGTVSQQQATIVENVIAVFEKTIRLDYGN